MAYAMLWRVFCRLVYLPILWRMQCYGGFLVSWSLSLFYDVYNVTGFFFVSWSLSPFHDVCNVMVCFLVSWSLSLFYDVYNVMEGFW